jgi:transglutaminase-like putative cysteine protease
MSKNGSGSEVRDVMSVWKRPKGFEWIAALLLFLMLREWLLPLQELTDTGTLAPFLVIAAGVLLMDLVVPYRWLTFPVKLVGLLVILHSSFFAISFFDGQWLRELFVRVVHDLPLALQQEWTAMTPLSRNALFDLLLVVLISMLSYLVLEQRQGLWFVFLTELYLAVLDTFMPYEADGGIVRTLVYGFLLLAVTQLLVMSNKAPITGGRRWTLWKSLLAPVLIVAVTVGIANAAPKKEASWPDPIAFFTGQKGGLGDGLMKKVGYDNNDEHLGGPFTMDETVVFMAITNERSYWRGDSKDVYTGSGWKKRDGEFDEILTPKSYRWNHALFEGMETKEVKASLEFQGPKFPTVFYPGQLKQLTDYTPSKATLVYDKEHQHVEVRNGTIRLVKQSGRGAAVGPHTQMLNLDNYQLVAEVPIISEKAMIQAGTDYPEAIRQRYLQLPDSLPPRIRDLAQQVTKDAKTPYEKVRAIENYLRTSGEYKYETKDVQMPAPGEDFVDQFLFETRRGYCDHFSTSMAVMLRTIGIPARWVKGFAPGHRVGSDGNGNELVEVRNKDAHSWVEVYFPGHGWIPFEATSTFVSPIRVKYDRQTTEQQAPLPLPDLGGTTAEERRNGRLDELEGSVSTSGSSIDIPWQVYAFGLGLLAVAGAVAWKRRRHFAVWWLQQQMSSYPNDRYEDRYRLLLRLVEHLYSRRRQGETLREYVSRLVISGDKRQDLWYLTHVYERMLYGYKDIEAKARSVAEQVIERLTRQLKP